MKAGESLQLCLAIHQLSENLAGIGQISPLVRDTGFSGIGDARQWTIRRHHGLGKPVASGLRAKEVAEAHNQRANSLPGGVLQLLFELDPNFSLPGGGILRRLLAKSGERVRTVVIDRTGQENSRSARLCRGDGIVDHGQDQLGPIPVTGRAHRVHNGVDAFDASTTDAWSIATPLIQSHPCAPEEGLVPRANARIFQPCRASARAVSPPIPPVAPSTRAIRVDSAISSSRNLSVIDYIYH